MPFPTDNLAQLQEDVRQAHLRHSRSRAVGGRFSNAFQRWRTHFEAKAALRDQNPAFAAKLLPSLAPTAPPALGFFVLPAGIRWAVDEDSPNTINLSVAVAGTVTMQVTPPAGNLPFAASVMPGPFRQLTTFSARLDGLYRVAISAGGAPLAIIYIPVQRARFLDFRELSRYLRFDFVVSHTSAAPAPYAEMLAVLYAADASAATGQTSQFYQLADVAAQLEKAPRPIALSIRG